MCNDTLIKYIKIGSRKFIETHNIFFYAGRRQAVLNSIINTSLAFAL